MYESLIRVIHTLYEYAESCSSRKSGSRHDVFSESHIPPFLIIFHYVERHEMGRGVYRQSLRVKGQHTQTPLLSVVGACGVDAFAQDLSTLVVIVSPE